jgi:hypothetical protein
MTTLELIDCDDAATGSVSFEFLEVADALTVAEIALDLVIASQPDLGARTRSVNGRFRVEVNEVPGPPDMLISRYLVVDQTDSSLGMVVKLDGETEFALGCFNLYFTSNLETGDYTLGEPFGVFDIADRGVMTMRAFGMPPLDFQGGENPIGGSVGFYAESGATPCAALDIGPEGVDSNDSSCTLTATGGGNLSLEGETADGLPFDVDTSWQPCCPISW